MVLTSSVPLRRFNALLFSLLKWATGTLVSLRMRTFHFSRDLVFEMIKVIQPSVDHARSTFEHLWYVCGGDVCVWYIYTCVMCGMCITWCAVCMLSISQILDFMGWKEASPERGMVNCVSAIISQQTWHSTLKLSHSSQVLSASINTDIGKQAGPIKHPKALESFLEHFLELGLSLEYIATHNFADICQFLKAFLRQFHLMSSLVWHAEFSAVPSFD